MIARPYRHQPITECSGRTMQQCDRSFAAGWLGVVATSLGNSGMCAKGGGQN
jgi:hypothetical protein